MGNLPAYSTTAFSTVPFLPPASAYPRATLLPLASPVGRRQAAGRPGSAGPDGFLVTGSGPPRAARGRTAGCDREGNCSFDTPVAWRFRAGPRTECRWGPDAPDPVGWLPATSRGLNRALSIPGIEDIAITAKPAEKLRSFLRGRKLPRFYLRAWCHGSGCGTGPADGVQAAWSGHHAWVGAAVAAAGTVTTCVSVY